MCRFCNVWVCVCVGFVMCGCVCVGFVMCGCFGNMCTCIYCGLYCLYSVFCIVSFMYIYSYLFCLYWCKDYCHRVTTQLQLVIIIINIRSFCLQYNRYISVCLCSSYLIFHNILSTSLHRLHLSLLYRMISLLLLIRFPHDICSECNP